MGPAEIEWFRVRGVLVALQVAFALVLSAGALLMLESVRNLTRVDPGFNAGGVLTIEIGLPGSRAPRHQQIYDGLLERVRALPDVLSASAVSSLPFDRGPYVFPFRIGDAGRPPQSPVTMKFVTRNYFDTMRTPIVEGEGFGPRDTPVAAGVVVSAALARRWFPGESPIGRTIVRLQADGTDVEMFDRSAGIARPIGPWRIVGVAGDVRGASLRGAPAEIVYVPIRAPAVEPSIVPTSMTLVIRTAGSPDALAAPVRRMIGEFDPMLSVARVRRMDAIVADSIATERFLSALLAQTAGGVLFLAALGIYGIAGDAVRRRGREIAIRLSLGARPAQIAKMIVVEAVVSVAAGAVVGCAGALVAVRSLRALLFGVTAGDPLSLALAAALVGAVAVFAMLPPVHRAIRLDPVAALARE